MTKDPHSFWNERRREEAERGVPHNGEAPPWPLSPEAAALYRVILAADVIGQNASVLAAGLAEKLVGKVVLVDRSNIKEMP